MRVLILGGTGDANSLAEAVARAGIDAVYSFAGRTRTPLSPPLPARIGGFGGVSGLADYIRLEGITHVVDATHPFATEMSHNAVEACARARAPLLALGRAPWNGAPGDTWIDVPDIAGAVRALPEPRTHVFLAIGRQHIAPFAAKPQHAYTLRFVSPADDTLPLNDAEVIVSRGPFALAAELALLRVRRIEWIVARNSGGSGARAKVDAARELGLTVIMIARPQLPNRHSVESVAEVMEWLGHRTCLGA